MLLPILPRSDNNHIPPRNVHTSFWLHPVAYGHRLLPVPSFPKGRHVPGVSLPFRFFPLPHAWAGIPQRYCRDPAYFAHGWFHSAALPVYRLSPIPTRSLAAHLMFRPVQKRWISVPAFPCQYLFPYLLRRGTAFRPDIVHPHEYIRYGWTLWRLIAGYWVSVPTVRNLPLQARPNPSLPLSVPVPFSQPSARTSERYLQPSVPDEKFLFPVAPFPLPAYNNTAGCLPVR